MTEIISPTTSLAINSNEFDALVGYFKKRGFEDIPSREISGILIQKATNDNIPVFRLVDTLKGLNPIELNTIITQVINADRPRSSTVGFNQDIKTDNFDLRNIESLQKVNEQFVEVEGGKEETITRIVRGSYVEEGYVDPDYVD